MMPYSDYTAEAIVARGKAFYQQLKDEVEPQHKGKFLVVDIDTGDYEIDDEDFVAAERLRAKHPDAVIYCLRIGYRTAHLLGFRVSVLTDYTSEVIVARGKELYGQLKDEVEPQHKGKFLAIDIKTGDYDIDAKGAVATYRLLSKRPDAVIYCLRIGYRTAHRLGFRSTYGILASKVETNTKQPQ